MALPITGILAGLVTEVIKDKDIKLFSNKKKEENLVEVIQEKIIANPVLKNELNQEPLYQSRTFLASLTGTLGGLFLIRDQFFTHGIEIWNWAGDDVSIAAYAIAIMGIYGLLGRTVSGLRPAFSWVGDIFRKVKKV